MPSPNVVILYADDLGFGDVGCYGAKTIPTPNIDRLAASGLRFMQGHCTAATCTPALYSLLTGAYPWRNPRAAILAGDAPMIIPPGSPTLAERFRQSGYRTGIVGKWHLGLGDGRIDWNREIRGTPNDVGFDDAFIMAATNDRVPCVYIRDRRVDSLDPADPIEVTYDWAHAFPGVPTGRDHPEQLKMRYSHGHDGTIVNGVSRIGHMRGGRAARWNDETMADVFAGEAVRFVHENRDRPFFLYYALHQPHVPRLPNPKFKGATPHGPRGDVIVEMDGCVGQLLDALEREGLREQTLILFSSDNGPVLDDGYLDEAEARKGTHRPAGPLRGGKYSLFDGGTRVPLLASWPGTIAPRVTEARISQVDFYASFAAMLGAQLNEREAPDSLNLLDVLLGRSDAGRDEMAMEGRQAKVIYWRGDWVYIPPCEGPAVSAETNIELGQSPEPQLYNQNADIGQVRNLAAELPGKVAELQAGLERLLRSEQTRSAVP